MPVKSQLGRPFVVGLVVALGRYSRLASASPRAMPPSTRSLPDPKQTAGTPTLAKEKWSERKKPPGFRMRIGREGAALPLRPRRSGRRAGRASRVPEMREVARRAARRSSASVLSTRDRLAPAGRAGWRHNIREPSRPFSSAVTARKTTERSGRGSCAKARACSISVGDAGAVVDRAVVDAVAIGVGLADAEMVPVRACRSPSRPGGCVPARRPDDVVRGDRLGLDVDSRR